MAFFNLNFRSYRFIFLIVRSKITIIYCLWDVTNPNPFEKPVITQVLQFVFGLKNF